MKKINMFIMALVAASLLSLSIPAMADSKGAGNPCAKNPCAMNPCAEKMKKHDHYKEHHAMKLEMMEMLRETMTIIKDLNHKPTDAEKKKLGDMIERLTEMEKKCKERKKECATKYKDKKKWRDKEAKEGKAHGE